jgi:hypothetical protein
VFDEGREVRPLRQSGFLQLRWRNEARPEPAATKDLVLVGREEPLHRVTQDGEAEEGGCLIQVALGQGTGREAGYTMNPDREPVRAWSLAEESAGFQIVNPFLPGGAGIFRHWKEGQAVGGRDDSHAMPFPVAGSSRGDIATQGMARKLARHI